MTAGVSLSLILNTAQAEAALAAINNKIHAFTKDVEMKEAAKAGGGGLLQLLDIADTRAAAVGSTLGSLGDIANATAGDMDKVASGAADVFMLLAQGSPTTVAITAAMVALGAALKELEKQDKLKASMFELDQAAQGTGRTLEKLSKVSFDDFVGSIKDSAKALLELGAAIQEAKLDEFMVSVSEDSKDAVAIQVKAAQDIKKLEQERADVIAAGLEVEAKATAKRKEAAEAQAKNKTLAATRALDEAREIEEGGRAALLALDGVRREISTRLQQQEAELSAFYAKQATALDAARRGLATTKRELEADVAAAEALLANRRKFDQEAGLGGVRGAKAGASKARADAEAEHTATMAKLRAQRAEAVAAAESEGEAGQLKVAAIDAEIDAQRRLYNIKLANLELDKAAAIQAAEDATLAERHTKAKTLGAELEAKAEAKLAEIADRQERARAKGGALAERAQRQLDAIDAELFHMYELQRRESEAAITATELRARKAEVLEEQAAQAVKASTEALASTAQSAAQATTGLLVGSLGVFLEDLVAGNEDAATKMAKAVTAGIGQQLVALGLQAAWQGAIEMTNPVTAGMGAAKLALGAGAIASGVGLGAAGAAIPTGATTRSASPTRGTLGNGSNAGVSGQVVNITFGAVGPDPQRAARSLAQVLARDPRRVAIGGR